MVSIVAGTLGIGCGAGDASSDTTTNRAAALSAARPKPPAPAAALGARPALVGTGALARSSARAFVTWAARSRIADRADARAAIHAAADNAEIARSLADEATEAQTSDHSRALIALALLGEMRSPHALPHLTRALWRPLPTTGTVIEGELVEQTSVATLEAKAVSGLAYLRSPEGDAEVLRAVETHPSVIVRSEAIAAYLWNHGESAEARAALAKHVRPEDAVFLDRVRRDPGEGAAAFDQKLVAFLQQHPERVPPAPVHSAPHAPKPPTDDQRVTTPPSHK